MIKILNIVTQPIWRDGITSFLMNKSSTIWHAKSQSSSSLNVSVSAYPLGNHLHQSTFSQFQGHRVRNL